MRWLENIADQKKQHTHEAHDEVWHALEFPCVFGALVGRRFFDGVRRQWMFRGREWQGS